MGKKLLDGKALDKGPFKGYKVEIADSTQVERHRDYLDKLLRTMGAVADEDWSCKNVFITDQSSIGHFLSEDADVAELAKRLDMVVTAQDLLIDVALRMQRSN